MISLFKGEEDRKKVLNLSLCIQCTKTCVQPVPYRFSVPVRRFLVVRKSNVLLEDVGKKKKIGEREVWPLKKVVAIVVVAEFTGWTDKESNNNSPSDSATTFVLLCQLSLFSVRPFFLKKKKKIWKETKKENLIFEEKKKEKIKKSHAHGNALQPGFLSQTQTRNQKPYPTVIVVISLLILFYLVFILF